MTLCSITTSSALHVDGCISVKLTPVVLNCHWYDNVEVTQSRAEVSVPQDIPRKVRR